MLESVMQAKKEADFDGQQCAKWRKYDTYKLTVQILCGDCQGKDMIIKHNTIIKG